MLKDIKQLIDIACYYPEEIERVLKGDSFLKFDPELGYIQINYIFRDGIYNTLSEYTYDNKYNYRKIVNYPEKPCRINTYGNSYTQCAQVSDGETWQEILAAHFREPIRNLGVGGYGVYQAYLRMMRIEKTDIGTEYIILNIWDDDHLRNIDSSRWIRVAWMHRDLPRGGGENTYPVHGFPWAHLRFDIEKERFIEIPGRCKNEDDLMKLTDREYYYNFFKDDHVVHLFALTQGLDAPIDYLEKLGESFGLKIDLRNKKKRIKDAQKLHITYGIKSTIYILEKLKKWIADNKKKLMVILSYDAPTCKKYIKKGERFDEELLEYLKTNNFCFIDTLEKTKEEYKIYKLSVDDFLSRLYIARAGAQVFGHYSPSGNFWFAWTIREELVKFLDPKPPAYR
ncbi:MAG TPA: hypothetical protein PKV21_02880 [bacterium]|nr:hypothetical protein [bacterium]HOM26434.1 hypothetical protein [bacterium]